MTAPVIGAGTASLAVLDAAYRATQARTAIAVAKILFNRWGEVEPDNLATTGLVWMRDAIATVVAGQDRARSTADAYFAQVRRLQAPGASPFTPPPRKPPNLEQIRKSLEFTAFSTTARELGRVTAVRVGEAEGDVPDQESADRSAEGRKAQLMEDAITRAASAAVRHITTAGHDRIYDSIEADPVATGHARVTKPGCCYFCAMLASRGFVYKEDSFDESDARFQGPGNVKVHDTCGCGLRPAFSRADPAPERNEALEKLWISMKDKKNRGESDIQAWRRIYGESELAQPFME